ncbi:Taxilin [Cordyceps fumosorosea ARSEF 2679]|uniref:Taxilin n=1 Tax=Cordyceps fumosorosea (strain ARSEF 2679) TaxID=1081104 RepID=A0A167P878_CORFA|nr:Taxilin [Cordyceps fumosorosea ARSEF 2679]OAA56389.1 Taxilin [Cordyceps fumosorosea ARSEF 2679]
MPATHAEPAVTNGHDGHTHLAPPTGKRGKGKRGLDSNEASRLLAARISQLEQDAAGEKDQELEIEREVKRATRDLLQQISKMDDSQKIDHLTKRSSELLADMRRLDKENQKNKKRGDALQKERDINRTELSKTVGLKEKLEKLCRELQRDNNKMKNENKELQAIQKRNTLSWDEKYAILLSKLEGYQEDKDTPRKQVVDMEMEELFRVRFKSFIEQYELRELHFHSQMRTKEIELQYHLSRFDRDKKAAEAELAKMRQLQTQVQTLSKTESQLREELEMYIDKLGEACNVKAALDQRDDIMARQRKEMQEQSKKCKRLEKENEALRRQKECTAANIIGVAQEWKDKMDAADRKTKKLMSIIHQMQQQGRKVPPAMESTLERCKNDEDLAEDEEDSDYSEEDDEEGEGSDPDDTEEESPPQSRVQPSQPGPSTTNKETVMRTYDVLQAPMDIDWKDDNAVQDSLLSTAVFLQDNPMISDFLSMTIDQAFSGCDPTQLTPADREAFWAKLTAPYHPDGRRKT